MKTFRITTLRRSAARLPWTSHLLWSSASMSVASGNNLAWLNSAVTLRNPSNQRVLPKMDTHRSTFPSKRRYTFTLQYRIKVPSETLLNFKLFSYRDAIAIAIVPKMAIAIAVSNFNTNAHICHRVILIRDTFIRYWRVLDTSQDWNRLVWYY